MKWDCFFKSNYPLPPHNSPSLHFPLFSSTNSPGLLAAALGLEERLLIVLGLLHDALLRPHVYLLYVWGRGRIIYYDRVRGWEAFKEKEMGKFRFQSHRQVFVLQS